MKKLTYSEMCEVDLKPLGEAASDWEEMARKLSELTEEARERMRKNAKKARWAGVNSDITRPFVYSVADEFGDAHTEAKDVATALRNAHTAFTSVQEDLEEVRQHAKRKGIDIHDLGNGTVHCSYPESGRHDATPPSKAKLRALRDMEEQVATLLTRATNRDDYESGKLTKSHANDAHNFSKNGSVSTLEAKEAIKIAREGTKMSPAELKRLNTLLKYNATSPEFTHRFFKGLGGPKETLDFYARMSIDGTDGGSGISRHGVQDLQRHLGPALANATDPGHKGYLNWGPEFRKLGTQKIDVRNPTYSPKGYQVLGGILRYGNYDKKFLTPIAEHIVQLQHKHPEGYWDKPVTPGVKFGLDPNGGRLGGYDPVASVMEGLGNSPAAAQEFFSKDTMENPASVYNEDGTIKKGETLGYDYLSELTKKDYDWNPDEIPSNPRELPDTPGQDAFGHALEAATTGRAYDSDDTKPIEHTAERAHLTERVVKVFGDNPDLLAYAKNEEKDGPLHAVRDSLGNITAEYMPDFQRALGSHSNDVAYSSYGAEATFNTKHVRGMLLMVGQDPQGYGAVTQAQQAFTSQLVDGAINDKLFEGSDNPHQRIGHAVAPGSEMAGIMSEGRARATVDYATANDATYNDQIAENAKWSDRVIGLGVDKIGERVPVAGEVIGWSREDTQESILKNMEQDSSDEADIRAGERYGDGRDSSMSAAGEAVRQAVSDAPGINSDTREAMQDSAEDAAKVHHAAGAQWGEKR